MIEIRHYRMEHTRDSQEAYNKLHAQKRFTHLDSYYLWLLSLLKPQKGEVLLDISTGEGRLVQLANKKGFFAVGIDFSSTGIGIAHQNEPKANWLIGNGEYLPFVDSCIDYITNIGSLEHFQNPEAGIREISRLLKPEGIACILLPNTFSFFGNILYNIRTGYIFDDGQPIQRYHSIMGWYDMLVNNGLMPYKTIGYELVSPRVWEDIVWYILHPQKIIRKFISIFLPKNLSNCIIYLCRKKTS